MTIKTENENEKYNLSGKKIKIKIPFNSTKFQPGTTITLHLVTSRLAKNLFKKHSFKEINFKINHRFFPPIFIKG